MTPAPRVRARRRRRRSALVVAPLLVVAAGVSAFVALENLAPPTVRSFVLSVGASVLGEPSDAPTSPGPGTPAPSPTSEAATPTVTPSDTPADEPTVDASDPTPSGRGYDVDSPDSITVVVNKLRPLSPLEHRPDDLVPVSGSAVTMRAEAADALAELRADAEEDGNPIAVHSAMRSYQEQRTTFEGWVAQMGRERAERSSARAGFSEHQTGLAVDVVALADTCGVISCFGETKASQWLVANAHRYGFVVRFDGAHEEWTGYKAEPWHLRYVGVEVATAIHEAGGPSLEEFFGLGPAPDYAD
ncbi:M15 family metallopeptidase [Sanguibacter massiliensis]|uniref:M15 family metallopeptidase n=1 Tax=Sanguibacter massiliensis TaxID=1973217 RepID=UPI0013EB0CF0|nr:M15 family metallopeptidase [Sanguibacter massiliensis]